MKVLLVVPTVHYNHHYPSFTSSVLFPSGFAYIASALKQAGHEVHGLNLNNIVGYPSARNMIYDKICEAAAETKPDMIGLGGLCTDYLFIKDSINIIRSISKAKIVLGGGVVTNDAEYVFNLLKPDFCIVGEAEEAIVELTDALVDNVGYEYVSNIGYWKNGITTFTKQDYNYKDINLLPFPDYEPFNIQEMMSDYILTTRLYPKPWIIITARSCPFSCTFCVHDREIKYRARSIDNIMQEIKVTYDKYHFNILVILDELFAINRARMIEFCAALLMAKEVYSWDFDWSFSTHASSNLDKKTLELAKESGCFYAGYGVESTSPKVLESMNKKIKVSQVASAIKLTEGVRISFGCNFIFGDPVETEDTVLETLDFAMQHCRDADIYVNAIRPYPGSKLFSDCIDKGIIKDKFDYYEHIDEQPWNFTYNMTSMSNKKWLPLLDTIVAYGQLYPWIKKTVAYNYEVESEFLGKQICGVWFTCPHCSNKLHSRELLLLNKNRVVNSNSSNSSNSIKLVQDAVVKASRLINVEYFAFRHPVYKALKALNRNEGSLLWNTFFTNVYFDTGCPDCGKSIRVMIPRPFAIETLSIKEIKMKLNLTT